MLEQIALRFLIGGLTVSIFAVIGDMLKPKSFAGLFGAAPSVALATLGLTVVVQGKGYAAVEARSMIAGALGFLVYAASASWLMMRYKLRALLATAVAIPVWFMVAFGFWRFLLR